MHTGTTAAVVSFSRTDRFSLNLLGSCLPLALANFALSRILSDLSGSTARLRVSFCTRELLQPLWGFRVMVLDFILGLRCRRGLILYYSDLIILPAAIIIISLISLLLRSFSVFVSL